MEVNENTARVRIHALGGLEITAGWILRSRRRIRSLATRELLMGLIAAGLRGLGASVLCEALWPEAMEARPFVHSSPRSIGCDGACVAAPPSASRRGAWRWSRRAAGWTPGCSSNRWPRRSWRTKRPPRPICTAPCRCTAGPCSAKSIHCWRSTPATACGAATRTRLCAAGARLLRRGDVPGAIELYERGLAVEDASEELYRALMVTQARVGDAPAAARTYERCRQSLEHRFGMSPSRATERARNESCSPQTGSGEGRDALVAYSATP